MTVRLLTLVSLLVVTLFATVPVEARSESQEQELIETIERFYLYRSQRRYDRMWTMLSKGVRAGHDNKRDTYVEELNERHLVDMAVEIHSIKIEGPRAAVMLIQRMQCRESTAVCLEVIDDVWVKENRKWLFSESQFSTASIGSQKTDASLISDQELIAALGSFKSEIV